VHDWIGRRTEARDILQVRPARLMQATLDREPSLGEGDMLPPLWHWLYFLDACRAGDLGRDGHARKGAFLPPVPLPRRMWAGGRLRFHAPLILGREARKRSEIIAIEEKQGRSGRLCFVTVAHHVFQDVFQGDRLALSEEHDIVYREAPSPHAPVPPPLPVCEGAAFSRRVVPDAVMLFRYSALTFNGHRIHYDAAYARAVEGYEGLVFHGPLMATLLLDLACTQTGLQPQGFSFRGVAPVVGMRPFDLEGRQDGTALRLWAKRADGALAMSAVAHF